ncbi:sigma-54-dependent Fis family transcriptional regulator [Amycolatopsis sp. GM8]|uniref:sigma-54-dependent Fis family transcriptional regulator n=1 Tax=Amycolatopsis sp. GM8 TaxID=2896530 RepID=UPI001F2D7693|nr:helix-turn-helix domain-containing protein [Amycolatopsis sp. GM8]
MPDSHSRLAPVRVEIAASWRRTAQSSLPTSARLDELPVTDVDPASRLIEAARPVLDRIAGEIAGSRFTIMLADRSGRIVDQRFGTSSLRARIENVGGVVGRQFVEENTGTNGVATVLETRHGIAVHGGEHYIEALRPYSCYGHPVFDRTTARLAGVLDITCAAAESNALMRPVLVRAAEEIELALIASARVADQRLLAAFRAVSRRRGKAAVVALGRDVVLTNDIARDTLDAVDLALLSALAERTPGDTISHLRLNSGRAAVVRTHRIGTDGGVIIEIRVRRLTAGSAGIDTARPVLISGEPGTGRTTRATSLLPREPRIFDAAAQAVSAPELRESLSAGGAVLIESMDRLDDSVARDLAHALDSTEAHVVLTSGPVEALRDEHQAIAARCPAKIELAPLRHRTTEIPGLAREILCDTGARLTSDALRALACRPWPGNLTELRSVLMSAAARAGHEITVADLPGGPSRASSRPLSLVEQAECATIRHALQACGHNRRAAARMLSISPTTLYKKLRAFGLDALEHAR